MADGVEHADCVRIPILPPKSFPRPDETLIFSFPSALLAGTQ
jgi:hypothetical protein